MDGVGAFGALPDVRGALGLLALAHDVAFDGDGEARGDFEGEVGEERAFGDGTGVDVGEEGAEEGDTVCGGGFDGVGERHGGVGVGRRGGDDDFLRNLV